MPGELAAWDMVTRAAPPALTDYAFDYAGYRNETGTFRQITTPSGGVVLILNLGDPYRIKNDAGAVPENFDSFIAGLSDVPGYVEGTGESAGVHVNLTPIGARLLTGLPMHLLTNSVLSVEDVFGPDGGELIESPARGQWLGRPLPDHRPLHPGPPSRRKRTSRCDGLGLRDAPPYHRRGQHRISRRRAGV